jgi:hypothetical protein
MFDRIAGKFGDVVLNSDKFMRARSHHQYRGIQATPTSLEYRAN